MKETIGIILMLTPFIVVTVFIIREDGFKVALKVWGLTSLIICALVIGAMLAGGEL